MFVNKLFTYLTCADLKSKRCFNVKSSTYNFHMKKKISADFEIYISVPLSKGRTFDPNLILKRGKKYPNKIIFCCQC